MASTTHKTANPSEGPVLIGNYFRAIHESLLGPIQRDSYLNGAFKSTITPKTHLVDIYTILITSPSVPASIKPALLTCRKEFIQVRARYPTISNTPEAALIFASTSLREVVQHMEDDARKRGLWIPRDNESDAQGFFMTSNNGNSAQFLSGVEGVAGDAPVEFLLRREEYNRMRAEKPAGDKIVAYRKEDENLLVEEEKKKAEAEVGRADFGGMFGKNLRRAFGDGSPKEVPKEASVAKKAVVPEKAKVESTAMELCEGEDIITPGAAKILSDKEKMNKTNAEPSKSDFSKAFAKNIRRGFE